MLSRLTAPVTSKRDGGVATSIQGKGVPELLQELSDIRAKKAELTKREGEIIAATQARLQQEQQALEGLKKKVSECGIAVDAANATEPVKLFEASAK